MAEGDASGLPSQLPFPVAQPLIVCRDRTEHPLRRWESLLFCFTQYLRITGLPLLAQYFAQPKIIPAMTRSIRALRKPFVSDWQTVIATAVRNFPKHGIEPCFSTIGSDLSRMKKFKPFLPGLSTTDDSKYPLELLRELRNYWGHGSPTDDKQLVEVVDYYLPVLEEVLIGSKFLHSAHLFQRTRVLSEVHQEKENIDGDSGLENLVYEQYDQSAQRPCVTVEALSLRGVTPRLLDSPLSLMSPYRELVEHSNVFMRTDRGDWPLYPLFVAGGDLRAGTADPVLLFDGHNQKRIIYLGVSSRLDSEEGLPFYEKLLRLKEIDLRLKPEEVGPWTVEKFASYWSEERLAEYRGGKYFPQMYVEREKADGLVRRFLSQSEKPVLLLVGGAGTGKSSLLCRFAEGLMRGDSPGNPGFLSGVETAPIVVLLPGHLFRSVETGSPDPYQVIRNALGLSEKVASVAHLFELLSSAQDREGRSLVFLFDAVNESEYPRALLSFVDELAATARVHRWVKVIITVRDEFYRSVRSKEKQYRIMATCMRNEDLYYREERQDQQENDLPLFSYDETEEAYGKYAKSEKSVFDPVPVPWAALSTAVRNLIAHPLRLLVFARAWGGKRICPPELTERDLFHAYTRQVASTLRDRGTLISLVERCLQTGCSEVDPVWVDEERVEWAKLHGGNIAALCAYLDPVERLVDAGFLTRWVEKRVTKYRFAHQAMLEYLIYMYVAENDDEVGPDVCMSVLFLSETTLPETNHAMGLVFARWIEMGKLEYFEKFAHRITSDMVRPMARQVSQLALGIEETQVREALRRIASIRWNGNLAAAVLHTAEELFKIQKVEAAAEAVRELLASLDINDADSVRLAGQAAELLATIHYFRDEIEESFKKLEDAVVYYGKSESDLGVARCHMRIAYSHYYVRMHDSAAYHFGLAKNTLEQGNHLRQLALLLKNAGCITEGQQAVPYIRRGVEIFEELGETYLTACSRGNLAVELFIDDDINGATDQLLRALQAMRESGTTYRINAILNNLGICHLATGKLQEAKDCFEEARKKVLDGWERAALANNLSVCYRRMCDFPLMEDVFKEAEEYGRTSNDPSVPGRIRLTRVGNMAASPRGETGRYMAEELTGAAECFMTTRELRGQAVTMGFMERLRAGNDAYSMLDGPIAQLKTAITASYPGELNILRSLDYYPWHIVLFE